MVPYVPTCGILSMSHLFIRGLLPLICWQYYMDAPWPPVHRLMSSFGMGMSRARGDFFDLELLNSQLLPYYATCFAGKMCSPTWST